MALSPEKKANISEVLQEWDNISESSFDSATPYDWRSKALQGIKTGNVNKMKAEAAPLAEYNVIDIMQNAPNDSIRLDAAKYILSQAGHGPIQKVDHNVVYEKMEPDQLVAILQSKLLQIKQLAPDLQFMLPANTIDAEIVEEPILEPVSDTTEQE